MMAYNCKKLLGKIVEKFWPQAKFAKAIGLSERSVSLKLNGKIGWRQDEIMRAAELLEIPASEIAVYFFTVEVQDFEFLNKATATK